MSGRTCSALNRTIPATRPSITGPSGGGTTRSRQVTCGRAGWRRGDQPDQRVLDDPRAARIKAFPLRSVHVGRLRLGQRATTGGKTEATGSGDQQGRAHGATIGAPPPSPQTGLTPGQGTPHVRGAPWPSHPQGGGTRCARSSPLPPRPHGPARHGAGRRDRPPALRRFLRGLPRHRRHGDGVMAEVLTSRPAISPCLRPTESSRSCASPNRSTAAARLRAWR